MIPEVKNWQPIAVDAIQGQLGQFRDWCLCGGQSLDWLMGRQTREHGDTDIGVFRSDLVTCLEQVGKHRVFLCLPPGHFTPWDGSSVPTSVHDIWISDPTGLFWVLQIMVYDDVGDRIAYRRDNRICWPKKNHTIFVKGLQVLNPIISLLFKLNKISLEDKDCRDVQSLIDAIGENNDQ